MKYKEQDIDELFVIQFIGKTKNDRQDIMDDMTSNQLSLLSKLVIRGTVESIKEQPMIVRENDD